MSITGAQVNEPWHTGIEKIAEAPPGMHLTCAGCLSDNPAYVLEESRLICAYETNATTAIKPLALDMATISASAVTDYSSVLTNSTLFLPNSDQTKLYKNENNYTENNVAKAQRDGIKPPALDMATSALPNGFTGYLASSRLFLPDRHSKKGERKSRLL